jgi:sigma-B regulation protein RsbU (phosphoserine phosphatase)
MKVAELVNVNSDVKTLIEKLEEDIRTARGIQRSLIPEKFAPVPGFKVLHKYLSGLKSGGDYLDFFEFEDKTHIGILMSDSSGYGLSSAFMSVILRLALKLSKDEARSPAATVARIFDELQLTMKPKENLSIFYGVLNRKTFELKYVLGGNVHFVRQEEGRFEEVDAASKPLTKGEALKLEDKHIQLSAGERMVIMSDGFRELFESKTKFEQGLTKVFGDDGIALVNELCFRVKQTFESDDDMPAQDCSVMIIDIEKRAMRLAK